MVEQEATVEPTVIERMVTAIRHRGPDDEGIWTRARVGLGNCRLAVLDLSPAGHMPMSDKEGCLWIIYNRKIYNYLELQLLDGNTL